KNLGAFGEGGAVTTSSAEVARNLRRLRDHGQLAKHVHETIGYNARLDSIQCTCLTLRLSHLPEFNAARRRHADGYRAGLADVDGVRLVDELEGNEGVHHLYVIRVDAERRDEVRTRLGADGVATAIHYPRPIHLQPAYAD